MPYERRPDRRPGGGRPGGSGRPPGDRPSFSDRPSSGDRPPRDRPSYGDRPPRDRGFNPAPRPDRPAGFAPRPMDDGGMSIRLDPRRLGALKLLAAEAGLRPGELVTRWVEERLDAARAGGMPAAAIASAAPDALAALAARIDQLAQRMDAMATRDPATLVSATPDAATPVKRGRGRPRKVMPGSETTPATPAKPAPRRSTAPRARAAGKVALHDEIVAVIAERGPQTAAELASAIVERGNYRPPRSAKPLDAAAVNARVSNPTYRSRFLRRERRIGLAAE